MGLLTKLKTKNKLFLTVRSSICISNAFMIYSRVQNTNLHQNCTIPSILYSLWEIDIRSFQWMGFWHTSWHDWQMRLNARCKHYIQWLHLSALGHRLRILWHISKDRISIPICVSSICCISSPKVEKVSPHPLNLQVLIKKTAICIAGLRASSLGFININYADTLTSRLVKIMKSWLEQMWLHQVMWNALYSSKLNSKISVYKELI